MVNREAIIYASVVLACIVLLLVILCHTYAYTAVFSKIKMTNIGRKSNYLLKILSKNLRLNFRTYHRMMIFIDSMSYLT